MEALEELEEIARELRRREQRRNIHRRLRDASNPLELPENIFKQLYRLNREGARDLFEEMNPFIDIQHRQTKTPPLVRFFAMLSFLAHGSYQKPVGQDRLSAISQSSVSRAIHQMVDILVENLSERYVEFPLNRVSAAVVKEGFFEKFAIPGIVGCIDCTHVKIFPPCFNDLGHPPNVYMNRKNFYSINCQIICDVNGQILSVNARYPGSVHDAAIWAMSGVKRILHRNFENGDLNTYLIGDSGYPLLPYLLTPIVHAQPNTPQGRYTRAHISIRNIIERTNGVLKGVWRCLHPDRVLHYKPVFAAHIIYACCILHNFIIRRRIEVDEDLFVEEDDSDEEGDNAAYLLRGHAVRNHLIHHYFL